MTKPWEKPVFRSTPLVWRDEGYIGHRCIEAVLPGETHQNGNGLAVENGPRSSVVCCE